MSQQPASSRGDCKWARQSVLMSERTLLSTSQAATTASAQTSPKEQSSQPSLHQA